MNIKLFPKQRNSIRESIQRINIWEGPVRSGKTMASIYRWIHFNKYGPRGNYAIIGKTERTLKHNVIDPLIDILGNGCKYNQGKGELYLGKKKSYVFGANDRRSEEKIRGGTWAGCYGDELTLWPKEVFHMALSRLSVDGAKLFGTTNTDSPFHWLKEEYLDRESELDLKSFHFELEDNVRPEGFLSEVFVNNLKKEYTGLWYKRFILGLWVLAEGAIYDMWDEDKYVIETRHKYSNYIISIDYGTANPCTFGLYGYNTFDKKFKVNLMSEYYYDSKDHNRQKTDSEYGQDFTHWLNNNNIDSTKMRGIYLDPSAASFKEELRKRGFKIKKADNSVTDGIRFVASLLSNNSYHIDRSCKHTIKEFPSYVWDERAGERGKDEPVKKNDHAMDRDRYGLYTHFGAKKGIVGVWGTE